MNRANQIQLEQDYQDTYGDYIKVSEMILNCTGKERQALLKLREILKNTIKVMEKKLENY